MNGYQKYKENSIYSMSGPELLELLFQEMSKRLSLAQRALDEKDYALFDDCLKRTSRIIRYLMDILDRSQPISGDLRRIYSYLIYDLSKVQAGRERRRDEIGRISHILSELGEAFHEAGKEKTGVHIARKTEIRG